MLSSDQAGPTKGHTLPSSHFSVCTSLFPVLASLPRVLAPPTSGVSGGDVRTDESKQQTFNETRRPRSLKPRLQRCQSPVTSQKSAVSAFYFHLSLAEK